MDFEDKVAKLKEEVEFCQLSHDEVVQQLVAADGSYDTAYSLLLEHVDELEQQVLNSCNMLLCCVRATGLTGQHS